MIEWNESVLSCYEETLNMLRWINEGGNNVSNILFTVSFNFGWNQENWRGDWRSLCLGEDSSIPHPILSTWWQQLRNRRTWRLWVEKSCWDISGFMSNRFRRNTRTILNMTRFMLKEKRSQKEFETKAVVCAVYLWNRCATKSVQSITLQEAWSGYKPNIPQTLGVLHMLKFLKPTERNLVKNASLLVTVKTKRHISLQSTNE